MSILKCSYDYYSSPTMKSSWYERPLDAFGVPKKKKIVNIFLTVIFYDNFYFLEFDDCLCRTKARGMFYDLFPGLPAGRNNAFRYTNGLFQNNTFFEYNEFTKRIVKSGEF